MAHIFSLDDDEALVLFEFLQREIDERDGVNLAPAMVSAGEYWALNALHAALERQLTGTFQQDYVARVRAARSRLTPQSQDTLTEISCAGSESAAMTGSD